MITFTETGCVDCGRRFRHPTLDAIWYSGVFSRLSTDTLQIFQDNSSNHFIILSKSLPGGHRERLFMSCQSFIELVKPSGREKIDLFLEGKLNINPNKEN